ICRLAAVVSSDYVQMAACLFENAFSEIFVRLVKTADSFRNDIQQVLDGLARANMRELCAPRSVRYCYYKNRGSTNRRSDIVTIVLARLTTCDMRCADGICSSCSPHALSNSSPAIWCRWITDRYGVSRPRSRDRLLRFRQPFE